jgi:hypothetical protein
MRNYVANGKLGSGRYTHLLDRTNQIIGKRVRKG